jgi:DNA-binding GntR family transcriptional regulator
VGTGLLDMYHLGAIQPAQLTQARIWLESIIVREACRRATPADLEELAANIQAAEDATRAGDFETRAATHLDFHRILARMTGNPVMVTVMNGVLDVLRHFIRRVGDYNNDFVLPSRRRFMKHMAEHDAEAAVAEMEASLKRLQRNYLSKIEEDEAPAATPAPVKRAPAKQAPARKAVAG